jgi:tol-pal system protein YbgF
MKLYRLVTAAKMAAVVALNGYIMLIGLMYSSSALSQATVRDSSPVTSNSSTRAATNQAAISSGAVTSGVIASSSNTVTQPQFGTRPPPLDSPNTAFQIQQLQQEVSELRGLVEEQAFNLKRLKQQRLDDYLDLDKRLSTIGQSNSGVDSESTSLSSGFQSPSVQQIPSAPAGNTQNTTAQNTAAQNNTLNQSPTVTGLSGNLLASSSANDVEEGRRLYRKAIDQLLNKQDYSGAQASFGQYLANYPTGVFMPNVYYWQGQIYLTENNKAAAESAFTSLVSQYEDHQKTPDAKYKLATIYFDQGKKVEAKKLLNEVVASNTDASRLAKSFLTNQY